RCSSISRRAKRCRSGRANSSSRCTYDIIRTYPEKLTLEIMWFKEKRNCSNMFISKKFPLLESICVYCNRIFNDLEPIPCLKENCIHTFCSTDCLKNHIRLRHIATK
ncbi:MAG: hypothetical protein ACXW0J_03515, partial [Nitrososphaeraceae archaeon]